MTGKGISAQLIRFRSETGNTSKMYGVPSALLVLSVDGSISTYLSERRFKDMSGRPTR
jgi:hypothetical protein